MTNCLKVYKNLQCESFGDRKKVTSQMLRQFCKNDAYLYDQIRQLWDLTDPETRKRFYPPYYMDEANSYGIESHILQPCEKVKYDYLEQVYRFSQKTQFTKILNFDVNDDGIVSETNDTVVEKNDNLLDLDYDTTEKRLQVIREEDANGNPYSYLFPELTDKEVVYTTDAVEPEYGTNWTYKTEYVIKNTKKETLGKAHLDAYCRGPYNNWHCNTFWYVGYNHNKNYNIKNKWRKDPDNTNIPTICRAQTFTAESSGRVNKVSFNMKGSKNTVSPCIVEIRTTNSKGYPTQKVLARTEKKFTHSGNSLEAFTFKEKAKVKKGEKYAIVIRSPLSNINHTYRLGGWAHTCFNSMKKEAYYKGDSFLSENNGKTWIHYGKNDNFCYAEGMHYPIDFGFEVYIQPITTTGKKEKVKKKVKVATKVIVKEGVAATSETIDYKVIEAGDYYLYLKPIIANQIKSLQAHINLNPTINLSNYTGSITWEWFNPETKTWEPLIDQSSGVDFKYYDDEFRYNYVKLRLKMTIPEETLYYQDAEELATLKASNLWKTNVKNLNTSAVLKIDQINFTIQTEPPTKAYLRTLFYHPAQDQMLPACIWSEVNADFTIKGNAECEVDIVHEKTAAQHFLFYEITDDEIKEYYLEFCDEYNINSAYNVQNILNNINEFTIYLAELETPIYLLPYTDEETDTEYTFFEDIGLLHYPAYPIIGCSMGKPSVEIKLDDISAVSQYGFKYVFDDNVKDILNSVNISYYMADTISESNSLEEREENCLQKGTYDENRTYFDNINAVSSTAFTNNEDEIDYVLLDDGKTIIFNINSMTLSKVFTYNSSSNKVSWNFVDGESLENDELVINEYHISAEFGSKSFQEWVDYEVDYDSKLIEFNDASNIKKGEMRIEYHPLWIRGLSLADFPLSMDLWIENYYLDEDGAYRVLIDADDGSYVTDDDSYIGKTSINPYTQEDESIDSYYVLETSVSPLDNIRKLTVNEDTDDEVVLVEDRDYFVDYLMNRIVIYNQLDSGSTVTVRYTPNLTDTGLGLAYRLYRPTYADGVLVEDETGIVRENVDDCAIDVAADDVIIGSNYFTVRT